MSDIVDVIVGTIGRPHGIGGEISIHSRTDVPEQRFVPGRSLRTSAGRILTVAAVRRHHGGLLLRFSEVRDRSGAEAIRGQDLWASVPADVPAVEADDFYDRHLIGLAVRDPHGRPVGTVASVLHLPAQDLLAIDTPAGERLVPFVTDLVPVVNLSGGFLVVNPIPGLLNDRAGGADED